MGSKDVNVFRSGPFWIATGVLNGKKWATKIDGELTKPQAVQAGSDALAKLAKPEITVVAWSRKRPGLYELKRAEEVLATVERGAETCRWWWECLARWDVSDVAGVEDTLAAAKTAAQFEFKGEM